MQRILIVSLIAMLLTAGSASAARIVSFDFAFSGPVGDDLFAHKSIITPPIPLLTSPLIGEERNRP